MSGKFSMDDYVDVAERISEFAKKYPEGTLQTISWTVEQVAEQTFIVYRAAAYRTPDDRRPGHGTAWEPFPGRTPYTKDSELMNAETSAWGRAIVACGLTSNRKIASKQEVQARAAQNGNGNGAAPASLPEATLDALRKARKEADVPNDWLRMQLVAIGVEDVPERITEAVIKRLTTRQAKELLSALSQVVDTRLAS